MIDVSSNYLNVTYLNQILRCMLKVIFCQLIPFFSCITLQKSLVWEGTPHCKTKWGFATHFWALSFEKVTKIFFPSLPLSRSRQTPKVINPSIMITTAVVLGNSMNKPLSDGPVLSIMIHKQLVRICLWLMGLSSRPHVIDWQVRGKKSLFHNCSINWPNERFSSCESFPKICYSPHIQYA